MTAIIIRRMGQGLAKRGIRLHRTVGHVEKVTVQRVIL